MSAGYGGMDGLPESSLYGSMISQAHISYPNGFEHFGDPSLGDQGVVEDSWNPANSDYQFRGFNRSYTSTTTTIYLLDARGTSAIIRHPRSSLSHLSTSFVLEPAVEENAIGSEYRSLRLSTINHTPPPNLPKGERKAATEFGKANEGEKGFGFGKCVLVRRWH